ncbi:Uncharacterised protein [uncultured archaeon]|nr:Uncharacterised protein [uncultured archaeon]
MLSGVQIAGMDAAGSEFNAATNSSGIAVIRGTPGSWELTFTKAGYSSVNNLSYDAIQTEEVAAYLKKAN